ncbi:peptidylprolyl isomerase [Halobacteriovorax sp. HLS]|uniref:peptidylprolyl isomerase n=1 Tax=Halobacteriovorax sp. HLS TaxID=2234000 RepID=UPI000FDBD457|nr:peptidylprolyl isomerase [Halobacteriovorax sp. HLS]
MSSISAKHILVHQEYEAQDLIKKLNDGTPFEELAKDFSQCASSSGGGDLGSFSKGMMVKPFEQAAFALKVGETSGIVKTQFGYHLIMRTA